MTTVYCSSEDCKWYRNGECDRGSITLDYDNECDDFESYLDTDEWQKPYWKRMIDREIEQIYRVSFHGKEIEIKGVKFFVDDNSDFATATEETTGLNAGRRCDLERNIDRIIEAISKGQIPPLETLPIGEYDPVTGKITPKEGERND